MHVADNEIATVCDDGPVLAHVAVPVAEVLPDATHPVTGERLAEVARRLAGQTCIVRRPDVRLEPADRPAQA